jgi:hypothetical protein
MPDAMMNGGFAPYLAQAFTPQGVSGGLFGSGMGNVPGNIFNNPLLGQNFGQPGLLGGVPPFTGVSQYNQQYPQLYTGWQQQMPQFQLGNPVGQFAGQFGGGLGWPYGQAQQTQYWPQSQYWPQTQYWPQMQFGQSAGHSHLGWQEPVVLANLLRQYAVPIGLALASPYGQVHIAQNIVQTAEMLARVLPLVGAQQLTPLAHLLGQCAQPISAAIASSPHGQAQIAQNIARMAEVVERIVPLIATHQLGQSFAQQPYSGWQQQVPQFPIANLLGQQYQQPLPQQLAFAPFGGMIGGQYGQGQLGPFPGQSGDTLARIMPFLAQQGVGAQGYGMARV